MMVDDIIIDALLHLLEQSPALAIVGYVAWQLRRDLGACINHSNEVLDKLLSRDLDRK